MDELKELRVVVVPWLRRRQAAVIWPVVFVADQGSSAANKKLARETVAKARAAPPTGRH